MVIYHLLKQHIIFILTVGRENNINYKKVIKNIESLKMHYSCKLIILTDLDCTHAFIFCFVCFCTQMTDFALRVKTDKGQQVLKDLSSTSTLRILRQKLANLSNISESRVSILVGYPPKPVDLSSLDQTLEEGGVKTGETVIVKELPAEQVPDIVANTMASQRSQPLPEVVTTDSMGCNGILLRQVVPSDNSCLFTSIGYVLGGKLQLVFNIFNLIMLM